MAPESSETSCFEDVIVKGKGYPANPTDSKPEYKGLKWFVQLIPVCLSMGTAETPYRAVTVDASALKGVPLSAAPNVSTPNATAKPSIDILGPDRFRNWPPASWCARAEGEPYEYLMRPPQMLGSLICRTRGKLMVLAAGQKEVDGPNPDPAKAEKIRTFLLPEKFIVENSSQNRPRRVKIFCAWISSEYVWALIDFSGLVRMHIKSKPTAWTESDLAIGSPEFENLFGVFKGGPDWVLETEKAIEHLSKWRVAINTEHQSWLDQVKRAKEEHRSTLSGRHKLATYFAPPGNEEVYNKIVSGPGPEIPPQRLRPIIKEICSNSLNCFSGFGRHLANDFLHEYAIFPGTPSYIICSDESEFIRFQNAIQEFLGRFRATEFLKEIASVPNHPNHFVFNEVSNRLYMHKYITVFRRQECKVTKEVFARLCSRGLLDPDHIIGEPYPEAKAKQFMSLFRTKRFQRYQVYFFGGKLRAYSVILAKCPDEWGIPDKIPVERDITTYGYTTTIGFAQFREHLLNRILYIVVRSGRPALIRTGQAGRPPKERTTNQAADEAETRVFGRKKYRDGIDTETLVLELTPEGLYIGHTVENDMDNAGDASSSGDGSATLEDPFYSFYFSASPANLLDDNELICNESFDNATAVTPSVSNNISKPSRPAVSTHDAVALFPRLMQQARWVLTHYIFETGLNPYHHLGVHIPAGVLTYSRAHWLLSNEVTLTTEQSCHYLAVKIDTIATIILLNVEVPQSLTGKIDIIVSIYKNTCIVLSLCIWKISA
ncbi:hypothetical protein CVT26_006596 [Gymnopilus dilepis]|uniref:Uncharacterized protein n=1 Tax=Gymnopilus dilepis TaxID=231916 RepID=A0A409Y2U2_9AGAR|nr:hypothetical protein CVT26_006596 [Gymnopilus dilepis]